MSGAQGFPYDRARATVLDLHPYQPGKPIEELERELNIANAVKLASNENPLGASPLALAALHESLDGIARYPDANGFTLKQALAGNLGVSPGQLTLGNGSNDVLDLLARVFAGPGDEIVYSEYAFLVYALVAKAVGADAVVTPSLNWGHDLDAMAAAVNARTKLVFLANPNNPTGSYFGSEALAGFLARVPDSVVIVLDEAYFEYVTEADYPNGLDLIDSHRNLVVTRTFSKIHGLASLRIGYAVASPAITDLLNRVRQPFNTSTFAQAAALAALEDQEHALRSREVNHRQLLRFAAACEEFGLDTIPSVGNFLTVKFGDATERTYTELLQRGIIVRPVANYGMPEHLRITIGRPQEMDLLVSALSDILQSS